MIKKSENLPIERQQLIAPINSSHALVVSKDEGRARDADVRLLFLVPVTDLNKKIQ
jgi:hypothetical protein